MEEENIILQKSYSSALDIIKTYKHLRFRQKEYELSKQLLRSGTSIGANVEEADAAPTKKDFANKMSIASKECKESHYWIRLLRDSDFLENEKAEPLLDECTQIKRI
ncbi:MAG TPA: four helix bundle protein [Bacteroidales bacterium]|jgi:four helix bundle protein|nr:four helix bundle protein [Bacteroidales bacterium]